ncbi:hypothetical protein AB0L10_23145 [Streptomyces flaveolus]|uniref:hypothetical protein n=1 Tax=Streptomyces flaveolus TaxID=67297 RepID=UPI003444670F
MRCTDRLSEEVYWRVLELLADLSPVVQALPPSAALVELKGVVCYHGMGAAELGEILRVRTLSPSGPAAHCPYASITAFSSPDAVAAMHTKAMHPARQVPGKGL